MNKTMRFAAVGALAALTLAACGDDDDASSDTTAAAPAATDALTATTAAAPDTTAASTETTHGGTQVDGPTVAVNAVDYAFEDLPASVAVGSKISLTNSSTAELHEIVVIAIPETETRSMEELVALPEEEQDAIFGETLPALVMIAPPGEEGFPVLGDGSLQEPGRYAVICAIPIGADPAEYMAAAESESEGPPQVAGGPPHFTAGMYAELVVE